MKKITHLAAALCATALFTPLSHAQDLYVGSNSSGVTTDFTSGTNAYANTFVGYEPGANSNTLNVLNTNTLLTNSAELYVGYGGSGNSLVISDGGLVSVGRIAFTGIGAAYIGYDTNSFNNSVLVTGTNAGGTASTLQVMRQLYVGNAGSGNSLTVSNGGQVVMGGGLDGGNLSVGNDLDSSNNRMVVTGPGSLLSVTNYGDSGGSLRVGFGGSGNSMVISDGGVVESGSGAIGYDAAASNNSVLVTGANSVWTNSGGLTVGDLGSSNSLVISNGGTVANSTGYIGFEATASNNSVLVSGAGSTWTNSGDLYVGNSGSGNSMVISDGGVVESGSGAIGYDAAASNNSVLVTGANSVWTNSGGLTVGYQGSTGNSLVVSNGGTVAAAGDGYISFGNSGEVGNNTALVTGSGSLLTIGDPSDPFSFGALYVGSDSSGNTLVISNGGTVSASQSDIGVGASTNNTALVTGAGSLWTNASSLNVGGSGGGHSLVISNGGTVATEGGFVGANSSNNTLLVTGAGSRWTNSGFLTVGLGNGNDNSSNSVVISNGGSVATLDSFVGLGLTSSNNTVLVTGAGSLWTNSNDFFVGYEGRGNSLVISDGGRVENNKGIIGQLTNALNNSVLVTGAASTWTNSGALRIAHRGSGTLTVASGGSVASSAITIASSNTATGTLNVGRFGTNDTGGTIIAPTIAFGAGTGVINFNQSDAVTITSAISGAGTIHQLGGGATTLSASNTYTGATTVSAGRLVVDGSIAGSTVTVNNGGTLTGSGAVGGIVLNLGSTISPGNSPGTLAVAGNSVWNAGANYNWQLYDTTLGAGTGWDLVNATGSLDLTALTVGSEFNINLWSLSAITPDANGPALNFDPNQNYTWTILTAAGGISGFTGGNQFAINTGAFNGTAGFANALNGGVFSIAQSGNDLNLVFTTAGGAPIPEPGTWAAAALLVGGAAFMRWRKRAKVA